MIALRSAVSRGVLFLNASIYLPTRLTPNRSHRTPCSQTLLAGIDKTHLLSRRFSSKQSLSRGKEAAETKEDTNGCPDRPPKRAYPFLGHGIGSTNHISPASHVTDHVGYPLSIKCGEEAGNGVECINDEYSSDRFYKFTQRDEVVEQLLPSVTTVLQCTMPARGRFRLYNWRKSMIKKHGERQFYKLKNDTIRNGSQFHKV